MIISIPELNLNRDVTIPTYAYSNLPEFLCNELRLECLPCQLDISRVEDRMDVRIMYLFNIPYVPIVQLERTNLLTMKRSWINYDPEYDMYEVWTGTRPKLYYGSSPRHLPTTNCTETYRIRLEAIKHIVGEK